MQTPPCHVIRRQETGDTIPDITRRGNNPTEKPTKGIEEVTYKTSKKVAAGDNTKTKTPVTVKLKKKRQMTPDPKQRKIRDLLTFWQGDTSQVDTPDTQRDKTRHQSMTVAPDTISVEKKLTVEKKMTPENIVEDIVTEKSRPEFVSVSVRQRDSPIKTRVHEIRQKFRSRVTATKSDQTSTATSAVIKRKAELQSESRPEKQRVTAGKRVPVKGEGNIASKTGPISKYFTTNLDQFSLRGQGGHDQVAGEVPGHLQRRVWEGGDVQGEVQTSACPTRDILKDPPIFLPAQPRESHVAVTGKPDRLKPANQSRDESVQRGKTSFWAAQLDIT